MSTWINGENGATCGRCLQTFSVLIEANF